MKGLLTTTERSTESRSAVTPFGQEVEQHKCHEVRRVPWYAAMLCQFGIHSGKWVYVTDGNCSQLKACGRCGKTWVRTRHQCEWRYIQDGACDQVKTCKRCGESTRYRTRHQREWQYIRDGACDQVKTCKRCGESIDFRTKHTWGASYSVDADHSAHQCMRCGEVQKWYDGYDD